MAANNNNMWNIEQFSQGRARALVRAVQDYDRRGRGRGQGPPPLSLDHPRGLITQDRAHANVESRPGGLPASSSRRQSRTHEDHPLMMPRRRYQEDPLCLPTPQPHPLRKITLPQIYPL